MLSEPLAQIEAGLARLKKIATAKKPGGK